MRIALHGKEFTEDYVPFIKEIIDVLITKEVDIVYSKKYAEIITKSPLQTDTSSIYLDLSEEKDVDFIFSIGGDGTLLDAVTHVKDRPIPILGINTGRLGFLATTAKKDISHALECFFNKEFTTDERALLRLETSEGNYFHGCNFALNEVAIIKKDSSSMIKVKSFIDGEFLNNYWADGLMVSTPTGSTGYSLSCGGPVILPHSKNFLITPINPHNLNVRPMVVSDSSHIRIEVDSGGANYLTSLDSRSETIDSPVIMEIMKETFPAKLIKLKGYSYLDTLRNKLNWGLDVRN